MSSENIVITKGDLIQVIEKQRLEDSETDGSLHIDTDEVIIEAKAEKFITFIERTFAEETEETDSEDGPAADIAAKIVSNIKEQMESALGSNTATKFLKLILAIIKIALKGDSKDKADGAVETAKHKLQTKKVFSL